MSCKVNKFEKPAVGCEAPLDVTSSNGWWCMKPKISPSFTVPLNKLLTRIRPCVMAELLLQREKHTRMSTRLRSTGGCTVKLRSIEVSIRSGRRQANKHRPKKLRRCRR